ncbi:MAG TPA: hypothetical protein VD994_20390 [Prosthecobacter sp.]|nr:hypothetical protein [Prosthecobacter sp.]
MKSRALSCVAAALTVITVTAGEFLPAKQAFRQEIATHFNEAHGLPKGAIQLIDLGHRGEVRALARGRWFELTAGRWTENQALAPQSAAEFAFADANGRAARVPLAWRDVIQVLRAGERTFLATAADPFLVVDGQLSSLGWPSRFRVNQIAVAPGGELLVGSSAGLFRQMERGWEPVRIVDELGRAWGVQDVSGVAVGPEGQLWATSKAGVMHRSDGTWRFYEGKDGLPWNEFSGMASGPQGETWFATRRGAIRFAGKEWHYRQGPRWLPDDNVGQVVVDSAGTAWFATIGGLGRIEQRSMTLAEKAEFYETEIERYIKRTPFGYVAEAHLRRRADKTSADPQDSDNDGLWTAMYGAGECFAFAATKSPRAKERAKQAFEALRFLQKVTQGGPHEPPHGYIARTIRPVDWPDPNRGRLEHDREAQKRDSLWKIYEPRWPKSQDGQWYWKSDTSSDELDGHYFFYPLYFDFCADSPEEQARVRDVVRAVTDHLLAHNYVLIDHDGRPTRWAIFGPQFLNRDPMWWPERGLNSLSILSYLSVAAHITGDPKYTAAARDLIEQHGYAHNAMYPKVQHGPGSGNQSDDEMAFMCYYTLLRYSKVELLQSMMRVSFFRYWLNEFPEMNPFFNFAYAAHNRNATATNPWGTFSLDPLPGWHEDAMATLYGFPLDRLNWPHQNSHRLDIIRLPRVRASDFDSPDRRPRGNRANGKVLPVQNRHFNHWNTDPWTLDYGGSGDELAAGTVFLLPYYLGLYHGFIEQPSR